MHRNKPSLFSLFALLASLAAGWLAFWAWIRRWGAGPAEARGSLPGDELVPHAQMDATQAIDIAAPPAAVWPWLAQMGQGRGGFYSYDWLENLFGMKIHNAQRIVPELQRLQVGDLIPFWPGAGVTVRAVEPPRLLVLGGTLAPTPNRPAGAAQASAADGSWTFRLEETGAGSTRLLVRMRANLMPQPWLAWPMRLLLEPASCIMQRKMLLVIKERAEGNS
jgi:hypothetical protein